MDNRTLNNTWDRVPFVTGLYDVMNNWIYQDDRTSTSNKINKITGFDPTTYSYTYNTPSITTTTIKKKEDNNMFNFGNFFNGFFSPVKDGCCKMAMNGKIAIKTSNGYKTFDVKTKRLVNCDNFAFDMPNMFWMVPTMSVKTGDIIMINGKPKAVLNVGDGYIETFSYEDSTIDKTVVETHVWMGKKYCYGKIVSPFGNMMSSDGGMENMMKMAMMSQMFSGNSSTTNGFNPMMFMLMSGKDNDFFGGFGDMFDLGEDKTEEEK